MTILATIFLTVLLVVVVVLLHYEALLHASRLADRLTIRPRKRILVVIAAAFLAHVAEIALFAAAFAAMHHLGLGAMTGDLEGNFVDYFYFSMTMYTTLGIGDVLPQGPMRLAAGIESLTGLVLITWTASFTFLSMQKFWSDH
jgi:hypothetical protein